MNIKNANNLCYLDEIRRKNGADKLKTIFYEMAEKNREKAVNLINDKRLLFCSLFILLPEIEALNLYASLNSRNIIAIKMCAKILKDNVLARRIDHLSSQGDELIPTVLQWILKTGAKNDGLSDDYDEVLDSAASLLIHTYKDKTILPMIADMIFKRNRKGFYIHDLVWVFFQACDLNALRIIAGYLRSHEQKDVELAYKLLNFVPTKGSNADADKQYLSYLNENSPFLYFTGESNLQTSNPMRCRVDLGAKYLCKSISPHNREPLNPYTEKECKCLDCFNNAKDDTKKILSKYSHKMHNQNLRSWNKWMQYTIEEQANIAKTGLGGRR